MTIADALQVGGDGQAGGRPTLGRHEEFEAAVRPHLPRLQRLCLALCREPAEAEDLLQEGLVRSWHHRHSWSGEGELGGWLSSIVRNQFLEDRRNVARRRTLLERVLEGCTFSLGSLFTGGPETTDPETQLSRCEQADMVRRLLHRLPEPFRLAVQLCDVEELGYQEASQQLGVPVGTVKSRHARGRRQLLALSVAEARDASGKAPRQPQARGAPFRAVAALKGGSLAETPWRGGPKRGA